MALGSLLKQLLDGKISEWVDTKLFEVFKYDRL